MEEFKIYRISDRYIEWLRKEMPGVYSNKRAARKHTRKYLGIVGYVKSALDFRKLERLCDLFEEEK